MRSTPGSIEAQYVRQIGLRIQNIYRSVQARSMTSTEVPTTTTRGAPRCRVSPGFKREWGHGMANLIGNIAFWRRVLGSPAGYGFFSIQGIHTGVEPIAHTHDDI